VDRDGGLRCLSFRIQRLHDRAADSEFVVRPNSDKSEFEDGDPILSKFEVLTALTTVVVDMTSNMSCHSWREQAIKMILGYGTPVLPDVENMKAEMGAAI